METKNETSPTAIEKVSLMPAMYITISVIVLIAGVVIGIFVDPYLPSSISSTQKGYQSGFNAAKSIVDNSTFGKYVKSQSNSRTLAGTITKVGAGKITLRVNSRDPFADPSILDRTVIINASTTITLYSEKASTKKTGQQATSPTAPVIEKTIVKLGTVQIGDNVGVFVSAETMSQKEPVALAVQILPRKNVGQ